MYENCYLCSHIRLGSLPFPDQERRTDGRQEGARDPVRTLVAFSRSRDLGLPGAKTVYVDLLSLKQFEVNVCLHCNVTNVTLCGGLLRTAASGLRKTRTV